MTEDVNFNKFRLILLCLINRECVKFAKPRQQREIDLTLRNEDTANEVLEKNLAERKAKMETLNIDVDDTTQALFDFLYRTLSGKCEWDGKNIMFTDMRIMIKEPYKTITLNGSTKTNRSIKRPY